jgi:hypothetical protein
VLRLGGDQITAGDELVAQVDSDEGYKAMLDGGVALAWTALDVATDPTIKAHLPESAWAHNRSRPRKN